LDETESSIRANAKKSHAEVDQVDLPRRLKASEQFRGDYKGRLNVVKASQMPLERSPDGLIKHIINEQMDTKECCLDLYQQFIPPGKATGKHRHLSEEVFYVIEGNGYDLHWDVRFDCNHEMEFSWEEEPKRFDGAKAISSISRPIARISTSTAIQTRSAHHRDQQPHRESDGFSTGSSRSRTPKDIDAAARAI